MADQVLIIGPAWVGDMVMAQTLFKLLTANDKKRQLDVLAPAWTFPLLSRMPEVREPIAFPITHGQIKLFERIRIAKIMRQRRYQQAIVLPHSLKSALIPWLARIPKRTGWVGEFRYGILNDARRLDKKKYPLMIEQFMALGLPLNAELPHNYPYPQLSIHADSLQQTLNRLNLSTEQKILALAAGAEFGPAKRWLPDYFAQVAWEKLNAGWAVWLFGSKKDWHINEEIQLLTNKQCKNVAGLTTLAETIDLLSVVSGLISNDSGLMHVAAALAKPVVAIYGPTSPNFTPPLSNKAMILKLDLTCQPCFKRSCPLQHHRCMRDLNPEKVIMAMATWSV